MNRIFFILLFTISCYNSAPFEEEPDYILLEWISWSSSQCYTTTDDCDILFNGIQDDEPFFCDEIRYYTDTNYFHCTNQNDYGFTEIENRCSVEDCFYEEL